MFFDVIARRMAEGGRVQLRGFGTFLAAAREPRIGRNPGTGEAIALAAKRFPRFRPAKALRDRVQPT